MGETFYKRRVKIWRIGLKTVVEHKYVDGSHIHNHIWKFVAWEYAWFNHFLLIKCLEKLICIPFTWIKIQLYRKRKTILVEWCDRLINIENRRCFFWLGRFYATSSFVNCGSKKWFANIFDTNISLISNFHKSYSFRKK